MKIDTVAYQEQDIISQLIVFESNEALVISRTVLLSIDEECCPD